MGSKTKQPEGYYEQELTDPDFLTPRQRKLREQGARIYLGGRIEWDHSEENRSGTIVSAQPTNSNLIAKIWNKKKKK